MTNFLLGIGAGWLLILITLIILFLRHRSREFKKLKQQTIKATERANELLKLIVKGKLLIDRAFRNDAIQILDFTDDKLRIKYKQITLDGIRTTSTSIMSTHLSIFLRTYTEPTDEEYNKILPFLRRDEAKLANIEYEEL